MTVAICWHNVREMVKVEFNVGNLGGFGQRIDLIAQCFEVLTVCERIVSEVLFKVGVRLGLNIAFLYAPVDVVRRAVSGHPEPERRALGAEGFAELVQVFHALGEGAGRWLPDRLTILPAVIRYQAVDLNARALQGFQELAVDSREVIALQVLACGVEPVVVVRVAAGFLVRACEIDDRLFGRRTSGYGEDGDMAPADLVM